MAGADGSDPSDCDRAANGDSPKDTHGAEQVAGAAAPDLEAAVYCPVCQMWLNGPTQFEAHLKWRYHRKRLPGPVDEWVVLSPPHEAAEAWPGYVDEWVVLIPP